MKEKKEIDFGSYMLDAVENYAISLLSSLKNSLRKKCKVYVNEGKRTVVLKKGNKLITIRCHEEDTFDWEIGFGLAISKLMVYSPKYKMMREILRDENRKLDYKTYAKWCIVEFFEGDEKVKKNFYEENVKFYESKKNQDK